MNQLRGVTGPEAAAIPDQSFRVLGIVAILAVIVLVAIAIFVWRRSRRLLAPDREALAAIERLPGAPTAETWARCEQIARRYLERQFGIAAATLTANELPDCISDGWREALTVLQTARFAPAQSSPDAWSRLVQQLESLIQGDLSPAARASGA